MSQNALPTGHQGRQPVQTLAGASNTAGTLTLTTPSGEVTTNLGFEPTAAQVEAALNALSQIKGNGGVTCTGGPLNTTAITITFAKAAAREGGIGNTALTVTHTLTGGTAPTCVVATVGKPQQSAMAGVGGMVPAELPHIIGNTGEVAYAAKWRQPVAAAKVGTATLTASSGVYQPLQYFLDQSGFVIVEGFAEWEASAGQTITTLTNALYIPSQAVQVGGSVVIQPNGKVEYITTVASTGLIAVYGQYRAAAF